jgi:hypothetical protein
MRARWYRTAVSAAVLMAFALLLAGSAFAVTITTFAPNNGLTNVPSRCTGAVIAISGSGFVAEVVTAVRFNGVASPYVQVGSNSVVYATVPDGATTGPITVTTSAGTATSSTNFTVEPCPYTATGTSTAAPTILSAAKAAITSFRPAKAKAGAKVTVTGTDFTGATAVKFGGVKATFKVVSGTKITATVPARAKSGKISVTTAAGTSTSSTSFVKA